MWRLRTGDNGNRVGGIGKGDPSRSVSAAGMFLELGRGEYRIKAEARGLLIDYFMMVAGGSYRWCMCSKVRL